MKLFEEDQSVIKNEAPSRAYARMQQVLVFVTTCNPPMLHVVEVGARMRCLHSIAVDLPVEEVRVARENEPPSAAHDTSQHQASPQDRQADDIQKVAASVKQSLSSISTSWMNAVAVLRPEDYLSFNLDLPFADSKRLSKIIELEVQDRIPFEVSDFAVDFGALQKLENQNFDVHVSLILKSHVRDLLKVLRLAGIEPVVITTPASAMGAAFHTAPDYLKEPAAAVSFDRHYCHVLLRFDGQNKCDRTIPLPAAFREAPPAIAEGMWKALATEVKLTLNAAETRYKKSIEQVYVFGQAPGLLRDFQSVIGRPIESLAANELVLDTPSDGSVGVFAAQFGVDKNPIVPLTNFRCGEFSYSPQLTEVFSGARRVLPYAAVALLGFIVMLGGVYWLRAFQIHALEEAMQKKVAQVLPEAALSPARAAQGGTRPSLHILGMNQKISDSLQELGTPSKSSPLDVLREIAEAMPQTQELHLTNFSLNGSQVKVQGTAASFSDVEKIERAFRRIKAIDLQVKQPQISEGFGPGGKRTQQFTFDMRLRD